MRKIKNTVEQSDLLDLVSDVSAALALSTVVTDAAGAAVIHVNGNTENKLIITITNQTSGAITISKLSGLASAKNYNILFKMPNNDLYFQDAPTIDSSSTPGTWELATDSSSKGNGWLDTIYLANTGTCVLTPLGQTGDSLTMVINYGEVIPDDPKALNIPVQVSYQNIKNSSGTDLKGTSPAQTMGIMSNAGWPSPLLGATVGPNAILNDGTSAQDLTIRMVNTSLDPLQFIIPTSGQPTQSYIEVLLPISDTASNIWALCNTTSWDAINVAVAGANSKGWTADKSTTTVGLITLTPDFSKITGIPPGGELELQLTGVITGYAPGKVQAQVTLQRFVLIGTQSLGVTIEKSSLIYNAGLGNGMQLSAGVLGASSALNITGDSSGDLVQITQSGSGKALQVSGGDASFSKAVTSASAAVSGAVTAGSAAISGAVSAGSVAATGAVTSASASISGGLTANSVGAKSAAVSGNLTATTAAVSGALSSGSISTNGATVNGGLAANSAGISNGINANGFIKLCDAPDYSKGTVGIGIYGVPNTKLYVNNNQSSGYGVYVNAPNLKSPWWALAVKGICINSTGSWYQISDMELKENVNSFSDGLEKLLQIEPIKFQYQDKAGLGNQEQVGVSAQEIQKIAPYMVGESKLSPDSKEEYLAMNPGPLTYMLINAVKELNAEIENLKADIKKIKQG